MGELKGTRNLRESGRGGAGREKGDQNHHWTVKLEN